MARATRPRFVDIGNPALAVGCPRCGLMTSRFLAYCRNCAFALWPGTAVAAAAFQAWRGADPARAPARPYDLELPVRQPPEVIDYEARAHRLGIHIFPSSNYPFIICVGFLFLGLAAVPFAPAARIALAALGAVVFLIGVVGWVVLEDTRMYPSDDVVSHDGHEVEGQGPHQGQGQDE